jgi:peptide/nickel transport system substrate-binding protein
MHKKFWILAAAAFAMVALASSASASSFAAARSNGKVTPFAVTKHSKSKIVVSMEQDLSPGCGWNVLNASCNLAWAVWVGWNPILRGPYVVAPGSVYKPDLATSVQVDSTGITYHIRSSAKWNYGGKLSPVTGADFIYTVQTLNNPNNDVASNTGVNQIASAIYNPKKPTVVRFLWKKPGDQALGGGPGSVGCSGLNACGPFADYKDLLGSILPQQATQSLNFNTTLFAHGIQGANGKYITDGPYYMSSWIHGQSVTLKANKKTGAWYGVKPKVPTVIFNITTATATEFQNIKGLSVDLADPQPDPAVSTIQGIKGLTLKFTAGAYLEHIDLNDNSAHAPILHQAYFRKAIMEGIDRQSIINTVMPYTVHNNVPGLNPINSLLVYPGDPRYKAPFAQWNFNQQAAINLLKANGCTGGPNTPNPNNSSYFTCPQGPAEFEFWFAADKTRRAQSEFIIHQELKAVGIKVDDKGTSQSVMFGTVTNPGQTNWDATEFAWGGIVDPGGFNSIWHCNGADNNGGGCNHTADTYMDDALTQLNPTTRNIDFINADAALAQTVPAIPLYALPDVLAYNSLLGGVKANPVAGFTWNMESWYWKG